MTRRLWLLLETALCVAAAARALAELRDRTLWDCDDEEEMVW